MILAILQARMSSTRLPGKVLKSILGRPMLARQIERILRSKNIDKLIVATSVEKSDDRIEALCKEIGISCYRGCLDDVLDRYYQASLQYKPDHVVRITGDCPLIDPELMDEVINFYFDGDYDYATNGLKPYTFPPGLDVEVFKSMHLKTAWKEAVAPAHREHVTIFIYSNPEMFKIGYYKSKIDLSSLRWTVDRADDYELVVRIYESLYPGNPEFTTQDILNLLKKRPELKAINTQSK